MEMEDIEKNHHTWPLAVVYPLPHLPFLIHRSLLLTGLGPGRHISNQFSSGNLGAII